MMFDVLDQVSEFNDAERREYVDAALDDYDDLRVLSAAEVAEMEYWDAQDERERQRRAGGRR